MTRGIINRFRVMDVSRGAVLNGHVVVTVLCSAIAALAWCVGIGLVGCLWAVATFRRRV